MNEQLFIPTKIKVGYQERSDTYSKKLAYVIYYDAKGVLRKEKSWRSWCQLEDFYQNHYIVNPNFDNDKPKSEKNNYYLVNKDGSYQTSTQLVRKALGSDDFDNIPMEGFVLNRNGGGGGGWNPRNAFIRVYDPRGFEFEISIPNLLFILTHSSSFKGKGLEGKFLYSWQGTELVLLPEGCEEYQKSQIYTSIQDGKVSSKELKEGLIYETKKQENLIYLGRHDWFELKYSRGQDYKKGTTSKKYVFIDDKNKVSVYSGLTHLSRIADNTIVNNYSDLVEHLEKNHSFNLASPVKFITKDISKSLLKDMKKDSWLSEQNVVIKHSDTHYEAYNVYYQREYKKHIWGGYDYSDKNIVYKYKLSKAYHIRIENGKIGVDSTPPYYSVADLPGYTLEEMENMNLGILHVEYSNNRTLKFKI